jgi:peptide/nickel transport system substrate-binding protein
MRSHLYQYAKFPCLSPRSRCRWMASAFLAVAVVLSLAGCSGSSSSAPSSRSDASGGTLRVGLSSAFASLDPMPISVTDYYLWGLLYDTPITFKGATPQPGLIQSWSMAANARSVTLKLRPGVTYSDGAPFNASALVWNIRWQQQPATASHALALWQQVTATAVNATEVRLSFPHPIPAIYAMLAEMPIVKPGAPNSGVGTGPFEVTSFVPGSSLTVRRNPHYWASGLPRLNMITLTNYSTPPSAAIALKSGTIDMYVSVDASQVSSLQSAGDKILNPPGSGFYQVIINTSTPPLNNPLVRQALSLAFDRAEFVQTSLFGLAQPLYSIFAPASPAYDRALNTGSYDLAKAKALLQQAGVKHLTLSIGSPAILPTNEFLPVYQQDLAQIGVTLKINEIDIATWAQESATGGFPQLLIDADAAGDYDPGILLGNPTLTSVGNVLHFSSPQYTAMVQAALTETNAAKRSADYAAIARYVQQQAFVFPLASLPLITAYAPSVSNVEPGYNDTPIWSQVSMGG